jgi:hypothetical protein
MFTKKITDGDDFTSLPASAQALYLHLNQGADDDGFTTQINLAMFKAHASVDDLKLLLAKRFVLQFDGGVIVIKHWRMHNTIRKDRYVPTNYQEELSLLGVKSNGAYTFDETQMVKRCGCQVVAEGLPDGCHSKDKYRLVENSEEKKKEGESANGANKSDRYSVYDEFTE